jgi:regulator of sigma E protease
MEVLIKAAQLILSLSILVVLHEFGHFLFAKLFKTRVEKFYLFFNPGFSLFRVKKGETEYGMGWLPLGGYVKISGMIDESMDKEQMKQPPKPYEFRSKPAWQRLLIMLGGVLMNFILAMLIYSSVLYVWGDRYLPTQNAEYGIAADSLAESVGFQDGDKIVSVEGKKVENFFKIHAEILLNEAETVVVKRDGRLKEVHIPSSSMREIIKDQTFISPRVPVKVQQVQKETEAAEAGLKPGDKILGINKKEEIFFYDELREKLKENRNKKADLIIEREGQIDTLPISVPESGVLGFALAGVQEFFELNKISYGFFESIPAGISRGVQTFKDYLKQLKLIFSPQTKAYKEVGSFITIGKIFPSQWDWYSFWNLTAFLSIILGILNVLPIPALDGGHVMFLLYEIVSGHKPSEKFLEYAQIVGMIILLTIFVYAIGNDFIRHVF